jgi:hypothetical protein
MLVWCWCIEAVVFNPLEFESLGFVTGQAQLLSPSSVTSLYEQTNLISPWPSLFCTCKRGIIVGSSWESKENVHYSARHTVSVPCIVSLISLRTWRGAGVEGDWVAVGFGLPLRPGSPWRGLPWRGESWGWDTKSLRHREQIPYSVFSYVEAKKADPDEE